MRSGGFAVDGIRCKFWIQSDRMVERDWLRWIGRSVGMNIRFSGRPAPPPSEDKAGTSSIGARPPVQADWEPDAAADAVGCSLGPPRLWFTLGYGIVNEVYWPRTDLPQIRDLGFIVADGKGFWAEVKRGGAYTLRSIASGVPAFEIVHTHPRYVLRLRISPDPRRDVLSIESGLETDDADMRLYVLLAPHLGATGLDNRAIVARHRGRHVLGAEKFPFALALVAVDEQRQDAIARASCGYVGATDGWQDFARDGAMTGKILPPAPAMSH
jgi:glucoamylase